MQSHQLKRLHKNKRSAQVGRGGKRGKTSGRGGKGQTARAGHKVRPEIRDMIKRIPKLRGRGKNVFQSFQPKFSPVNLNMIERHFVDGETITPESLATKGLVRGRKGGKPLVKILATGGIAKKFTISGCAFSASAKIKVEKAGGTIA